MELYHNLLLIRKRLWLIILTAVVACISAAIIQRVHPAQTLYVSTATLALNPDLPNRAILNAGPGPSTGQINSNGLAASRIDMATLVGTYDRYITSLGFDSWVIKRAFLNMAPEALSASIDTQLVPNTLLYQINVTGYNKDLTHQAATALAQGFLTADMQAATQNSLDPLLRSATQKFWQQRITALQLQLLTAMADTKLAASQKYTQAADIQQSITEAQGYLAQLSPTGTHSTQATAATWFESVPPLAVGRSVLVKNAPLFAALGGLILGCALALLWEYLDSSLRSAEEASDVLSLPVLATISVFPGAKRAKIGDHGPAASARFAQTGLADMEFLPLSIRQRKNGPMVTISDPFHASSEGFRNLRTSILFASAATQIRTLAITSPLPEEGKSAVAANLAVVMAKAGTKVILVDADMRRPTQHTLFDLPLGPGLSSLYLADEAALPAALTAALQATSVPSLRLLDAGELAPNPAELLASTRTSRLIEALKEEAEIVIFDTPAMALLTDAVILASHADGTMLLVRANSTRREVVKATITKLTAVHARVLGVTLNMLEEPRSQRYNYSRYYRRDDRAREALGGTR